MVSATAPVFQSYLPIVKSATKSSNGFRCCTSRTVLHVYSYEGSTGMYVDARNSYSQRLQSACIVFSSAWCDVRPRQSPNSIPNNCLHPCSHTLKPAYHLGTGVGKSSLAFVTWPHDAPQPLLHGCMPRGWPNIVTARLARAATSEDVYFLAAACLAFHAAIQACASCLAFRAAASS